MTALRERAASLPETDLAALSRLGLARGGGPQSLIGQATAVVAALAVMFGALYYAVSAAEESLEVIGHTSGPQVVATTDLYYALSDADSQVATVLLLGGSDSQLAETALGRFEQRRGDVAAALLEAHRLAGSVEAQRGTIESIMARWGEYQQLAAVALLLAERAEYSAGAPPPEVLEAYQEATELMSGQVLPQAYNLTLENATIVRASYDDARGGIDLGFVAVALAGLVALALLVWLQVHLARHFRRVFNPSLVVATAVAVLYLFTGLTVLDTERESLTEAKQDGFDAVLSLERAKAISNGLHADRVRFLLDEGDAEVYEQTYFDKAQQLVYVEAVSLPRYQDTLAESESGALTGLVGDALDGSAEAERVFATYRALILADAHMRGDDGGPSVRIAPVDLARADYEEALDELSGRHLDRFASAIAAGEDAIAGFAFLLIAAMVSLGVFTFSGIVPRLREYR